MFVLGKFVLLMFPVEENYGDQHVIKSKRPTKTERNRAERKEAKYA
jgi:hypothetical protein